MAFFNNPGFEWQTDAAETIVHFLGSRYAPNAIPTCYRRLRGSDNIFTTLCIARNTSCIIFKAHLGWRLLGFQPIFFRPVIFPILEWSKHNVNLIQGIPLCLCNIKICANEDIKEQRWGLLSWFPPFRYFLNFSALSKHTLAIEYHVNIWQVWRQLSCGGTCQT